MTTTKFVFLTDLHWGHQRKSGHKTPLHDERAMNVALQFVNDFKPDVLILGGDMLDAGCISHHNKNKPGRTEGMRLQNDADGCRETFIEKLPKVKRKIYICGNHDGDWLTDFEEDYPAFEGMLNIKNLLKLDDTWEIIDSGGHLTLGKLVFVHGNQLQGGEHVAKAAVIAYEKSIRFGHYHTAQLFTKNTPVDNQLAKTGMAVPCLARKNPAYAKGKPNRHVQGFSFGYVFGDGGYSDQLVIIINGKTVINGKVYVG